MTGDAGSDEAALLDLYCKKTVSARWGGRSVALDVPETGFSSYRLDHGTLRLLRQLDAQRPRWARALDLGCGYGPIALHLAVTGMATAVAGVDRDALAVSFAARNAAKNSIVNCEFVGGLGYEPVSGSDAFDAIVSNVPAKAGEPVHRAMLHGASQHLAPGGEVAIVVVAELEERMDRLLADDAIVLRKKVPLAGHIVYLYGFSDHVDVAPWPYARDTIVFTWRDYRYEIETAYGLPEFDTLSHGTDLLLAAAAKRRPKASLERIIVWNPGQGHVPLLLSRMAGGIEHITLASRDALALEQSAKNLNANGACQTVRREHGVCPSLTGDRTATDLFAGVLDDKEGVPINLERISRVRLALGETPIIVTCSASLGSRLARAHGKRGLKASVTKGGRGACVLEC